jgi:plasmid stabilization system protein ParE
MEVVLTDSAEKSLQRIYHFYNTGASKEVAHRVVSKIFDRIDSLSKLSKRGRIENNLIDLKQNHRFVLEGYFKIILHK